MADVQRIQLAHGGGGQLTAELIREVILPALGGQDPAALTDSAVLAAGSEKVAFTTDTYVVQPLEFAGGDIGKLAVCGTINDLAVAGAEPMALSFGMVIQEGLEIALLRRVLCSAGAAARAAGVKVVTGDTKVVERGACDGLMINTAGVGRLLAAARLGFDRITPGDRIVLSGPLGQHGLAVMSRREGLTFATELASDCAAIDGLTASLINGLGDQVRFMRDPTRGGLAAVLVEIASAAGCSIEIDQSAIPLDATARAAAELLGLDLLTVANEGKLVAVVSAEASQQAVLILRDQEIAATAAVIGTVGRSEDNPLVEMLTTAGGRRVLQMPYGEELPRIC